MSTDHLKPESIGAYIDGELELGLEREAFLHLQQCHKCSLEVLHAYQLKSATKDAAGARFQPSEAAIERLKLFARHPAPRWISSISVRVMGLSGLAALLVLGIFWGVIQKSHQSNSLTAELLDQHLASLPNSATPQVISTDRHTVKPWFQGKLPFSFNIPEPSALPPDTTLQGADLTYLEGRPTALLFFMIHKHHVSVFITQADRLPRINVSNVRSGFNVDEVKADGLELFGMSDVGRGELDALMQTLAKVQ